MNNDTKDTNCNRTDAGRNADPRSSEEIKHDIDRTLYEMDQTATQLQGKLSLHGLIDEVKDVFTTSGRRAPGRLMEAARDNPVPAALIGLGVVWMVADRLGGRGRHESYEVGRGRDRDWLSPGAEYIPGDMGENRGEGGFGRGRSEGGGMHIGRRVGEAGSHLKEGASGMIENVREKASGAIDAVKERISGVGHSVSHLGSSAKDRVSHLGERVSTMGTTARHKLHNVSDTVSRQAVVAKDKTVDMYEETPLAFGAAALALGVVGGLIVPSTRREDELLGPVSDRVKDRAKDLGQTALHQGQQMAQELGSKLKDEVGGITGGEPIGDKIRDVASRVVDTTKQHVRESVQSMSKGQTGPGNQIGDRGNNNFGDQGGAPQGFQGSQGLGQCDLPGQPGNQQPRKGMTQGSIGDEDNVD